MQAGRLRLTSSQASLKLLLFVDERPGSREQIEQICAYLEEIDEDRACELEVIDIVQQPYLAEHFKLVATPALMKVYPEPRHTLAGQNLVNQLKIWWDRWIVTVKAPSVPSSPPENQLDLINHSQAQDNGSIAHVVEMIELTDQVFKLKQEKEELLAQLKFKDRAIAMLAHDLRNPLTAVTLALGTLEIAQSSVGSSNVSLKPGLAKQLIAKARSQLRSIDKMVGDLLQGPKGSNELNIQPQKLDLGALCEDVLGHMQEQLRKKSQPIRLDIPSDLPFTYADSEKIRQVLVNLLDNAIKYTPMGTEIRVSILHKTSEKVQVTVCDRGPGIPEENFDLIFQDRFRLQRDVDKEGYGLGLSVCQQIVRAHYGRIWVESILGKGSCFNFTLPVYRS
ncbi:histidine kinase [Merismopedia glauca]|uniref:Adaptive-response sensory-kinase SasA n=1 Tax=Merismopedia glauca CCAP 1448/3 TaxID=1296344 RepID=A0A2T1BYD4_9CYAN|nr:histidine kinase [Merismopedia glauca]PSB01045.1 histidine kinase [Merismopedia glauca CCAP 1448/3]